MEPVVQFEIGSHQNFIYLILDRRTHQAAIIDPQADLSEPSRYLMENGFELTTILLTHTHSDHTAGVIPLLMQKPHLEIRVGELDLYRLPETVKSAPGLKVLRDGEVFKVGELELKAIHTPGHSPGAFSYFLDRGPQADHPHLFTGDTIFIRDCGRTDFRGGSNAQMFASIQKVKRFPPETSFWVGHHYAEECTTTLAQELESSPPFKCKSVEELEALP